MPTTDDIISFVKDENISGDAERDPYGYAAVVIDTTLAWALDDGIVSGMSERERDILSTTLAVFRLGDSLN